MLSSRQLGVKERAAAREWFLGLFDMENALVTTIAVSRCATAPGSRDPVHFPDQRPLHPNDVDLTRFFVINFFSRRTSKCRP